MATTSNKRSLDNADIGGEKPTKKRKLNETTASPSISASINPSASVSLATDAQLPETSSTKGNKLSPTNNPEVRDVNVNTDTAKKAQNAHTAKAADNNKNESQNGNAKASKNGKSKKNGKSNKEKDPNSNAANWAFSASSFTFGDHAWVKQTSNASELSNDDTPTNGKQKLANESTTDSFSQFEGLGFKQVLDSENSKETATSSKTEKGDDADNDGTVTQEASDSDKATNGKDKADDEKTTDASPWGAGWSNSNPDGTFKLNFDWGSWDSVNTKIDLNPSTKVGWESQATAYDPNAIEEDETTKAVLEQMAGEQDTGDKDDDVKFSMHCKVYCLEGSKYVERGKGVVKVNTYTVDGEEEDKKIKGRILCRRDTVLTTIINAPILKEMQFKEEKGFIRFCVVETKEKTKEPKKSPKEERKEKKKAEKKAAKAGNTDNRPDNEHNKNQKKQNEKESEENEDDDLNAEVKTYLIKPLKRCEVETFINKIKEIQKQISQ